MNVFLSALLVGFLTVMGLPSLGSAAQIYCTADLDGPSESPPNASPGTGFTTVILDTAAHTLEVQVSFSGLLGTTTASHIHAATAVPLTGNAGVATQTPTFSGFPLGVTSGTYDNTFDTTLVSTWNVPYLNAHGGTPAGAEAALAAALLSKTAYLNIHTNMFPAGEIRGFLVTPVPTTLLLFGSGLAGLAGIRFSRKRQ